VVGDELLTERLLRVIDEGRRTATYKLALLLALLKAAALAPNRVEVGTRELAQLVLEVYWPQARIYVANDGIERELRQITTRGSPPVRAVFRLRLHADVARCRNLEEARRRIPEEYDRALDSVEETFVRYPIPLLQVVGRQVLPFLYEVDWPEGTSVNVLRREKRDRVSFLDGVPDRLVVLCPLLRPLIELHWARDVARWTGVATEDDRLRAHLFGTDRLAIPAGLRSGLAEMQDGRCFYCSSPLARTAHVDHFLAWSRWPNDAVENLVLADRCNAHKSDHLAAPAHLRRWVERGQEHAADLAALADNARWLSDPLRSTALVRTTYLHLAPGTPLWVAGADFEAADGPIALPG